ncbi:MAG: FecR family protein [Bacteroidetes bacterium]|nr:FecR family protein [Bacteroidota bacterium]
MEQEWIWNLIAKKLSGESTQEELQELEVFLRSNPDLHYSMQTIIDLWNSEYESGPGHENTHQAFTKHIERMKKSGIDFPSGTEHNYPTYSSAYSEISSNSRRKSNILLALGSVVVFAGILFLGLKIFGSNNQVKQSADPEKNTISEISTKNGSKTTLTLPDGTIVKLNAGSKISYDDKVYGSSLREVNLTGEAFFDVVKNPEKPFVIHTGKINIRVLGTAFNVKSYPGEKNTETSLIRGSLEVTVKDRPSEKYILKPNEKLIVANDETVKISATIKRAEKQPTVQEPIVALKHLTYEPKDSTIVETSWVENKLIFQDQNFKDLATQLERWYGVKINFQDPEQEEMRFTGIFQNETIQQALEALKLSNRFSYTISGNQVTILK